ncbi:hypothetical protein DY000_02043076 [Brassica cretica]|uniref:Uncharacterized protein n=1 Tax=Brassica cretica TaxID=69181 RepID=A0ABQ7BLQ9_BRACR|nr:hypothetical protein DY000_02043076 [Brassica cretica]
MIHNFHRSIVTPNIDRHRPVYERWTKRGFDIGGSSTAHQPPPVCDQHPWPREREDEPIALFDHFEDTHKAAKSSACRNRAIEDTWDDYDSIFYNEWLKVSIEPTRFVDPDVIWALGIKWTSRTYVQKRIDRSLRWTKA